MDLQANENIVKQGKANFKKSTFNAVGGTLYLTNKRLIFQGHGFNFGGKTAIDLDLQQLVRCQSGAFHLVSGDIEVFDRYHNSYTFVVYGRKSWADAIEQEIVKNRNSATDQPTTNTTIVNQSDSLDKLKKLKELLDAGVITEEEFDEKKKALLDDI